MAKCKLFKAIKSFIKRHSNDPETQPGHALDKTKVKAYNKMWKTHKKNLIKLAKEASPYQADDGIQLFIEQLRFMKDFYELGYNVWAMERKDEDPVQYKDMPTRYESLKQALDEYDAIDGCEDKYIVYHFDDVKDDDFWHKFTKDDSEVCEYKLGDFKTSYDAYLKERKIHEENFKKIVEKYIDEWWD